MTVAVRSSIGVVAGGGWGACAVVAYGRASDIPGPNIMMFGLDTGEGEGARSNWAGPIGAGVGMAGLGRFGALRSGP